MPPATPASDSRRMLNFLLGCAAVLLTTGVTTNLLWIIEMRTDITAMRVKGEDRDRRIADLEARLRESK